jgi:hypothetical protein
MKQNYIQNNINYVNALSEKVQQTKPSIEPIKKQFPMRNGVFMIGKTLTEDINDEN